MTLTKYYGSPSNYPSKDQWMAWPDIFNVFKGWMLATGNTADDVGRIWDGITQAAQEIGVEERVILAIIIKESSGDVGINNTIDADGKVTGGLMQCEGCFGFPGQHGLPEQDTVDMIKAGTTHFKGCLQQEGNGDDAATIYKSLRVYNTGRVNDGDLNDDSTGNGGHSDPDYVSVIANYLQWITG